MLQPIKKGLWARVLEAGVNYFDTAVQYGDGESERNLGRVLAKLSPANIVVGTKVRLLPSDLHSVSAAAAGAVANCVEIR